MTFDQFLTLIATILGAVGSIYVLKSILRLTPEVTKRLSARTYGHDPNQIDSLSAQKAESVVGTILIILALAIAILNAAFTPSNFVVSPSRLSAILIAVALTVIVCFLLTLIGKRVDSRHRRDVAHIIIAEVLDKLSKSNSVPSSDLRSLRYIADKYLDLKLQPDATPRDFLRSIAMEVGRTLPEDIQIEGEKPSQTPA
jgi:hypothetical protein